LVARGEELSATNSSPVVQARAKQTAPNAASGMLLCVNTSTNAVETQIRLPQIKPRRLKMRDLTGRQAGQLTNGILHARLEPLATRAYFWGREPKLRSRRSEGSSSPPHPAP